MTPQPRNLVPEAAPDTLPVVTDGGGLVNPRTGQVVDATSTDTDVIDLLRFIRDCRKVVDALDGEVSHWLRDRSDVRRRWTFAGGQASVPSDRPNTEWSLTRLAVLLPQLVDTGHISQTDADACLATTVQVVASEVNRLKNEATPDVAQALMDCRVEVPKTSRRVSLK
jgi:hypothetical protein